METSTLPRAVSRFVETTNAHDGEALFSVFAAGANVTDNGANYGTDDELREWITVHQVNPRIVLTPISFEDGRLVASVDGDFEGGPLTFAFDFSSKGDLVTSLAITQA